MLDGVYIYRFNIDNEQTDLGEMEPIGVFCHEYGHVLGAPDLYDYDSGSISAWDNDNRPVMYWCLMAAGSYGYSPTGVQSAGPTHMSGFIKNYYMGWATPTTLAVDGTYTLKDIETNSGGSIFKILINGSSTEYFFIENRYPGSSAIFDKKDGYSGNDLDAGLIIMHIDESMPDGLGRFNDGTPQNSYYGAWVEDPGQPSNLSQSPYLLKLDAAHSQEDGQTEFGPSSTPYDSDANDGSGSGISITNIGNPGALVSFHLDLESPSSTTTTTATAGVNLTPYTPSGWDGPIVSSSVTETNVVNTLYGGQPTYIDWAALNEGPNDITETFFIDLYVDDEMVKYWYKDGLQYNYYTYVKDWEAGPVIEAGSHILKLVVDGDDDVAESNEDDNVYEETFTWESGSGSTTTTAGSSTTTTASLSTTTTSIPYSTTTTVAPKTTTTTGILWTPSLYESILGEESQEKLSSLRNFRDEVLSFNQAGRRYVALLYHHSDEIALLLSEDPEISSYTAEVMGKMMPVARAALNGREKVIPQELIYKILTLLGKFEVKASPDLKVTIKQVKRDIRMRGVFKELEIAVE